MYLPDYSEHSLLELYEALENLNKEKYPDRLQIIEEEIEKRKAAGEVLSFYKRSLFWPHGISVTFAVRVWWCYFWRSTLAALVFSGIVGLVLALVSGLFGFEKEFITFVIQIFGISSLPVFGTFFMIQALGKKYIGYRIHVLRIEEI